MDLIIVPLGVYIGKMLLFNRKCLTCIYVAYKLSSKYVWGNVLIASSLENRRVGLIQSRVPDGAQRGGGW